MNWRSYPQAVSGQSPPRREKGTVRNFGAVYCVVGDVLPSVVKFVASCFVVHGLESSGVHTLLLTDSYAAVDAETSTYDVAVVLRISHPVYSLS